MTQKIAVRYFGSFSVQSLDGTDLTPTAKKSKALLALLCETDDMRRSRSWLSSKLWSDRAPEQANGSLRQTLSDVRKSLAPHIELGSNRSDVWLDLDQVETDLAQGSKDRDFLEGLDVRDQAFEEWLRDARARYEGATPEASMIRPSRPLTIRASFSQGGCPSERIAGLVIADKVARSIEETLAGKRFVVPERNKDIDIDVRCDVAEDEGKSVVFVRVESAKDGQTLYSGHRSFPGCASDAISAEVVDGIVHTATTRLVHRLPRIFDLDRPEVAAVGFSSLGLSKLASFTQSGFAEANDHFDRAYEIDNNNVFLAWRAFVRMAQLVEGVEGDRLAWIDEIQETTRVTLEKSPDNGLSLALVSLTRLMLDDDLLPAAELAELAATLSDHSIFSRQTLAVAHSATGDVSKAYELSKSCQAADPDDELKHLWELYHALVCIGAGKLDEARLFATKSAKAAPKFLAPRRQLVALCAHAGDISGARSYLNELASLEQNFSLDRYLNDESYPNLTLRKAGLIDSLKHSPLDDR